MMDAQVVPWVYDRLPFWKRMVSKDRVYRMIVKAYFGLQAGKSEGIVAAEATDVEAKMGVMATIILTALVGQAIRLLIEWARERGGW